MESSNNFVSKLKPSAYIFTTDLYNPQTNKFKLEELNSPTEDG